MRLNQLIKKSAKSTAKKEEQKGDKNRVKIPITKVIHGPGFPRIGTFPIGTGNMLNLEDIRLVDIERINRTCYDLNSNGIPLDKILEKDRKYLKRAIEGVLHVDMNPKTYELSYSISITYYTQPRKREILLNIDQSENPLLRRH